MEENTLVLEKENISTFIVHTPRPLSNIYVTWTILKILMITVFM